MMEVNPLTSHMVIVVLQKRSKASSCLIALKITFRKPRKQHDAPSFEHLEDARHDLSTLLPQQHACVLVTAAAGVIQYGDRRASGRCRLDKPQAGVRCKSGANDEKGVGTGGQLRAARGDLLQCQWCACRSRGGVCAGTCSGTFSPKNTTAGLTIDEQRGQLGRWNGLQSTTTSASPSGLMAGSDCVPTLSSRPICHSRCNQWGILRQFHGNGS